MFVSSNYLLLPLYEKPNKKMIQKFSSPVFCRYYFQIKKKKERKNRIKKIKKENGCKILHESKSQNLENLDLI